MTQTESFIFGIQLKNWWW